MGPRLQDQGGLWVGGASALEGDEKDRGFGTEQPLHCGLCFENGLHGAGESSLQEACNGSWGARKERALLEFEAAGT